MARLDDYLAKNNHHIDPKTAQDHLKNGLLRTVFYIIYYEKAKKIFDQNYKYSLRIDKVLQSAVKFLFDVSHRYQDGGAGNVNCPSTALVVAGILPMPVNGYMPPLREEDNENGIHQVSIDMLVPGDIITLFEYDHSFIYLNEPQ